jgi:uncharacterized damage-inducible protein DinB
MTNSILADAFGHHTWATLTLLDACARLTDEQLATTVPGTFGSIIGTLRHTVAADTGYLELLAPGEVADIDEEDALTIGELRATMAACGEAWERLAAGELDGTRMVTRHRDDGSDSTAPLSIRIVQVIHHGTDHRSQVCTALSTLGIEPPEIDVWAYAWKDDRLTETEPTTPVG